MHPKPNTRTIIRFLGGPFDGTVDTDDPDSDSVTFARFLAIAYEDNHQTDACGNDNPDSPIEYRYDLTDIVETDGILRMTAKCSQCQRMVY